MKSKKLTFSTETIIGAGSGNIDDDLGLIASGHEVWVEGWELR